MSKTVQVRGYYRANGTYVAPHTRSAPTRRSSGSSANSTTSRSSSTSSSTGIVHVRGYTRSNGTYVAPHTRSAPTRRSSSASASSETNRSCSTSSSSGVVHVRGYTRSNGTYVAPHTRSAPKKPSSNASYSCYSSSSTTTVNVTGCSSYIAPQIPSAPTKISNPARKSSSNLRGTTHHLDRCIKPVPQCNPQMTRGLSKDFDRVIKTHHPTPPPKPCEQFSSKSALKEDKHYADNAYNRKLRRVGTPLIAPPSSNNGCYADNAHNRQLKRVGKPIPMKYIRQREIIERSTEQEIVLQLETLVIQDTEWEVTQSAMDRLHQEKVEEMWGDKNVIPEACDLSPSIQTIAYDDLDVKDEIGHGEFGTVCACLWKGKLAAYKKFIHQQMSRRAKQDFVKEIEILVSLNHPHTVKMFGAVLEKGKLGFVMEYMSRTLFQALFNDMSEFEDDKKKSIVSQLASALEYLHTHQREIAHCDIKSQNVLLDRFDNAKLCDFGLSLIRSITETSRSSAARIPARGTPRYSAPEVLRGESLNKQQLLKTDIYSLAVCVFEVVTEEEPFYGLTLRQLEAQVGHGSLCPTSDIALSEQLSALLRSCWDSNAKNRPTATQFVGMWKNITTLFA